MGLTQNNTLFFYSPLHTVGGFNTVPHAIAICQKFDVCVVGIHTGEDIPLLNEIIQGVKQIKPTWQIYGYVQFGSVGSGQSATLIDNWIATHPPSSGLLDGIFLDEFGHDFPSGDREQQNMAVSYCHQNNLPAYVNAWQPQDVFGSIPGDANNEAPVVGSNSGITDIILVENFVGSTDATDPITQTDWVFDKGRLDYYVAQRDVQNKNIKICCMVGAGSGTVTDIGEKLYDEVLKAVNDRNVDYLCVNHGDIGATWLAYFHTHVRSPHNLNTVIPSGTPFGTEKYPTT